MGVFIQLNTINKVGLSTVLEYWLIFTTFLLYLSLHTCKLHVRIGEHSRPIAEMHPLFKNQAGLCDGCENTTTQAQISMVYWSLVDSQYQKASESFPVSSSQIATNKQARLTNLEDVSIISTRQQEASKPSLKSLCVGLVGKASKAM